MRKKLYKAAPDSKNDTLSESSAYFNVGPSTIKKLAKECDARIKIGSLVRYRRDILEEYIESLQERA